MRKVARKVAAKAVMTAVLKVALRVVQTAVATAQLLVDQKAVEKVDGKAGVWVVKLAEQMAACSAVQ